MFVPMPGVTFLTRLDAIIDHHNIELDEYQREERRTFARLSQEMYDTQQELHQFRVGHTHVIGPREPYDPDDEWFSTSAVCVICGQWLGWWCPDSESGRCEYAAQHGEMCVHCGQPEERK